MDQRVPSILLAAILVVLLASAIQDPLSSGPPEAAQWPTTEPELRSRIAAIESRLTAVEAAQRARGDVAPTSAVVSVSPDGERQPVPMTADELRVIRGEIRELRGSMAALSTRSTSVTDDPMSRATDFPTNQAEVERFAQLLQRDPAAAMEPLIMLSTGQVLRRFGRPHSVWLDGGKLLWGYKSLDRKNRLFSIAFLNGTVISR